MLASLFRANSGQRNSQYIESVTDDAHTRNLLFGQSPNVLNFATSPPPSPFGSPVLRPHSFDDHGGLELEEKDIRVILAQDAQSGQERPTVLFDSKGLIESTAPAGKCQSAARAPLPANWRPSQKNTDVPEENPRHRSSTFSENQSSWSRASKDVVPKDDPFLECMFGSQATSSNNPSSTKMHILPAKARPIPATERFRKTPEILEQRQKPGLKRSQTSGPHPTLSALEDTSRDSLLITRLFTIELDENNKVVDTRERKSSSGQNSIPVKVAAGVVEDVDKPPKLMAVKTPIFAIGLIVQLPYPLQRPQSSQSRPALASSYGQSLTSANSSYGSDMQFSWTFLDAIPKSLTESVNWSDEGDRRVDMIVSNWDVILRSISCFEHAATKVIHDQLSWVIAHMHEAQNKMPKAKSMQRVNQQRVAIHDVSFIAKAPSIAAAASDISRRIAYAVRIPRVLTGLGFVAGHWADEARVLYRACGGKQQNFFFFNLLTAFLGNHMQWLERLAPEWYRKQFQAQTRKLEDLRTLTSRTVIVSDHKGLARRLVYSLASFLPGRAGIEGFHKCGEHGVLATSISPAGQFRRHSAFRRPSKPSIREARIAADATAEPLSTSASSHGSHASTFINRSPRKPLPRRDSNRIVVQNTRILPATDTEGAGTTSTVVPHVVETPAAYLSLRDSYFPESAIEETNDSVATADLNKVLRKVSSSHRRTSSVSSRWGSLVSGFWSNRQSPTDNRTSITTISQDPSPVQKHTRTTSSAVSITAPNTLDRMVDEAGQLGLGPIRDQYRSSFQGAMSRPSQSQRMASAAPRLHVDDKDGVVDVELDLPGFLSASSITPPTHRSLKSRAATMSFGHDCSDSVLSLGSMASKKNKCAEDEHVNVGGYLRRHHEDFVLHAVRPSNDLMEDVKRAMRSEPTSRELKEKILQEARPCAWVSVCTTLVADTRLFSVHRLTLRRQYEVKSSALAANARNSTSPLLSTNPFTIMNEEISDEAVMEFDATLADAIEKLLNIGLPEQARSATASRTHSRNVSASSSRAMPPNVAHLIPRQDQPRKDALKVDHRDVVVSALEDVVKSVNEDITKSSSRREEDSGKVEQNSPRQANALREGVKNWLLNVEQTSVW